METLFRNDCGHNIYLGSDDKSDFYLYFAEAEESMSICRRFGEDGDYEAINYEYRPERFIQVLTSITKIRQNWDVDWDVDVDEDGPFIVGKEEN